MTQSATHELTPAEAHANPPAEAVVVRFAGDSGDGMQLTGGQFTLSTALAVSLGTYVAFGDYFAFFGILHALALFSVLVSMQDKPMFLQAPNITNIFLQNGHVIILALGMLLQPVLVLLQQLVLVAHAVLILVVQALPAQPADAPEPARRQRPSSARRRAW